MKRIFFSILLLFISVQSKSVPMDSVYKVLNTGSIGQVRKLVLENLKESPNNSELLLLVAKLSMEQKSFFTYYQKLLKQTKKTVFQEEALYRIGQFYYSKGNYSNAIKSFGRLVKDYSDGSWFTLGLYWLGYSFLNQQKPVSPENLAVAHKHFTHLLTSTPSKNSYQVLVLMGLIDVSVYQGNQERTLELLDIAFESLVSSFAPELYLLAYLNNQGETRQRYKQTLKKKYPLSFEARWMNQIELNRKQKHKKSVEKTVIKGEPKKELKKKSKKRIVSKSKKGIFIQLGFFSSYDNAKRLLDKKQRITKMNLHIEKEVVNKASNKASFYLVRSKNYASRKLAYKVAQKELEPLKIPYYIRDK